MFNLFFPSLHKPFLAIVLLPNWYNYGLRKNRIADNGMLGTLDTVSVDPAIEVLLIASHIFMKSFTNNLLLKIRLIQDSDINSSTLNFFVRN